MHSVLLLPVLVATKIEIMRLFVLFSDEDLYRGAEELTASQDNGAGFLPPCQSISPPFPFFCLFDPAQGHREGMSVNQTFLKQSCVLWVSHTHTCVDFFSPALDVEDRCSLAPAMDILSYSEREWRGNTAKSALIRKVGAASSLNPVVLHGAVQASSSGVAVCCCRATRRCPAGSAV